MPPNADATDTDDDGGLEKWEFPLILSLLELESIEMELMKTRFIEVDSIFSIFPLIDSIFFICSF